MAAFGGQCRIGRLGLLLERAKIRAQHLGSLMQLLEQLDGYALQTKRAITIPLIKSMLESE